MHLSSEKQGLVLYIVRVLCCLNVDLQQEQRLIEENPGTSKLSRICLEKKGFWGRKASI